MSEVHNTAEAPVAAVEETPVTSEPVVDTPVAESTPAVAETTEHAPVESTTETAAPVTEAPKAEFTGEGILGYKAPGGFLKKLAGFQKKYFWFGSDAVESKHLSNYLRGEKAEVANHNAAWASQTGKGLLFFSKLASEKATPAGVINLADVTDVTTDGSEFSFLAHGGKHVLQAPSFADRESWVTAIKAAAEEAKASTEGITSSDGYKESHSALSKPAFAAPAVAPAVAKAPEVKKEEKVEAAEAKKEEKAEAKEEKKEEKLEVNKARKSRSASRKRNSIFGNFGLGSKKEEKTETPVVEPTAVDATPAEVAVAEAEPVEAAAVPEAEAPVVEPTAVEAAPVEAARPVAGKRNSSIFGNLSSRFGSKKSVSEEAAPVVPAKDAEAEVAPVSAEAPILPAPETTEPLATSLASPATVPTEATNATSATEEVKETKPVTKSEKRKSSLPFGFGTKKEKATSDSETEKPLSPFAKLRQTVKSKSSPKAEKAAAVEPAAAEPEAKSEATTEVPAEEPVAATEEAPVVSEPVPVATNTHQVSATA